MKTYLNYVFFSYDDIGFQGNFHILMVNLISSLIVVLSFYDISLNGDNLCTPI